MGRQAIGEGRGRGRGKEWRKGERGKGVLCISIGIIRRTLTFLCDLGTLYRLSLLGIMGRPVSVGKG